MSNQNFLLLSPSVKPTVMLASYNTYKLPSSAISFIGCLKIQRTFTTKSAKILRKEHKVLLCSLFSLCSFVRTSCALWLKTFLRQSYLKSKQFRHASRVTGHGSQVVQRNWFDPWGNPRDTIRWLSGVEAPITNSGFTGHEHYLYFKIINMNGRLYDPVICRFFIPDNFVQLPEFSQSYNRYSYCLNNPLKYTDPSGWLFTDVDDHYFNQHGEYLGSDNTATDKVRIINKETWDKKGANISFIGSDGATIISQAAAHLLSRDVSEANLSDKAALNIYQHYNSTGFPLVSSDGNFNMRAQEGSRTIAINLEKNRQQQVSDHFNEIKNIFIHERQHLLDFNSGFKGDINIMEQRAIKTQMGDPTFSKTRPVFQKAVIEYGIQHLMKF